MRAAHVHTDDGRGRAHASAFLKHLAQCAASCARAASAVCGTRCCRVVQHQSRMARHQSRMARHVGRALDPPRRVTDRNTDTRTCGACTHKAWHATALRELLEWHAERGGVRRAYQRLQGRSVAMRPLMPRAATCTRAERGLAQLGDRGDHRRQPVRMSTLGTAFRWWPERILDRVQVRRARDGRMAASGNARNGPEMQLRRMRGLRAPECGLQAGRRCRRCGPRTRQSGGRTETKRATPRSPPARTPRGGFARRFRAAVSRV